VPPMHHHGTMLGGVGAIVGSSVSASQGGADAGAVLPQFGARIDTTRTAASGLLPSRHHALVVGNNAYTHLEPLEQCVNDAHDMAHLLSRKGYGVTLLTNATKAQLRAGLARLVTALTPGAVVVVFFSGHGVERGGENYLVPVDGEPEAPGTCGCACGCVCVWLYALGRVGLVAPSRGTQAVEVEMFVGALRRPHVVIHQTYLCTRRWCCVFVRARIWCACGLRCFIQRPGRL
jgi:hypothetical protein